MGAEEQSDDAFTWYERTITPSSARTPLSYDIDADVCVIGGGLAGLTVAREVARRGWTVALLEARHIAWNASGRNSGVVLPGFSAPIEKVVERIGLPAARALWELSQSGVEYIRGAIEEIGDTSIIEGEGWLHVSKWPDGDRILARVGLLREMAVDVESWQTERVRNALRSSHYFQAIHVPAGFQINPLAYALGLADTAVQAGARIFENTRVTTADLAGIRKRIDTSRGRVRAAHVVLAGNIHLDGIARPLADTLIPVTAFTGVTPPLGKQLPHAVAFRGAVSDSRRASHHYRVVDQNRLLWTGSASAGSMWARKSLERAIHAVYPQLGPVRFEYFWPAATGFAVHRMPQIGQVQPGVWLASAFGGHGLNTSAMAGQLLARAIVEGDDTWRRFLPFELVWAGGRAGRAVAYATAWWQRQSEAVLALAARRREELQGRSLEKKKAATSKARTASPWTRITFPSGYNPTVTLKRILKSSPTAEDRPIDAPEAVPAASVGDRGLDGAKRNPGRAMPR
jgi:gamma-glutamylputrescine oxidase